MNLESDRENDVLVVVSSDKFTSGSTRAAKELASLLRTSFARMVAVVPFKTEPNPSEAIVASLNAVFANADGGGVDGAAASVCEYLDVKLGNELQFGLLLCFPARGQVEREVAVFEAHVGLTVNSRTTLVDP